MKGRVSISRISGLAGNTASVVRTRISFENAPETDQRNQYCSSDNSAHSINHCFSNGGQKTAEEWQGMKKRLRMMNNIVRAGNAMNQNPATNQKHRRGANN